VILGPAAIRVMATQDEQAKQPEAPAITRPAR
jgi:hypothetical protein